MACPRHSEEQTALVALSDIYTQVLHLCELSALALALTLAHSHAHAHAHAHALAVLAP